MSETPYNESNALLALMRGDEDQAKAMLAQLLPNELRALGDAADRLDGLVKWALETDNYATEV